MINNNNNNQENQKYEELNNLNKDYPKFDEIAKHIQKDKWSQYYQNHNYDFTKTQYQPKGKFVWVPEPEEEKTTNTNLNNDKENDNKQSTFSSDIQTEIKNGTGKWKWEADDDDVEEKIIANGPIHPTYYEQIKIYQDIKSHTHPYAYDFAGMEQNGEQNGNNNDMGKEENDSTILPTKSSPIMDIFFPSYIKGKDPAYYKKK